METLKGIGGCLLTIAVCAAIPALAVLFFLGAGWVSVHVLTWLLHACVIETQILFFILLPLSAVKKARGFAAGQRIPGSEHRCGFLGPLECYETTPETARK